MLPNDKYNPVGDKIPVILRFVSDFLDSIDVVHFLAFGTALQAYRNDKEFKDGNFQKNDYDLDIHIFAEDAHKITKENVVNAGFHSFKWKQDIPKWIKENGDESKELMLRTISFVCEDVRCDIDPLYKSINKDELLVLKGRKREKFCGVFKDKWFNPAKWVMFNKKIYLIPNNDEYYSSNYGEDWKTPMPGVHLNWNRRSCRRDYYEIIN